MKIGIFCKLGLLASVLAFGLGCEDKQESLDFRHPPGDAGTRDSGSRKADSGALPADGGATAADSGAAHGGDAGHHDAGNGQDAN